VSDLIARLTDPAATGPVRWREAQPFPAAASEQLAKAEQRATLRRVTRQIRGKRAAVVDERDDWEALRRAGEQIKTRVLRHLDTYLEQAEDSLQRSGVTVHWAGDAHQANHIVHRLVRQTGQSDVVKIKSMVTAEIGLNEYLAARGITAVETDLAELIVQMADDRPSHIVVPAIHRNRHEIRDVFAQHMPGVPADLPADPAALAGEARRHLRETFLRARVAVSGANFLVADTGTLAIVESEGNGRMCLTLPDTLITVVGIEKIVPTFADLEVFLQLLPRSSTGERMNPYTSLWTGVKPGDGPQNLHVVLLDNGRTKALADPVGRQALRCIRCSACLNVCPVYERTGGHAYGSVYPGPIGAILTPQLRGMGDPVDRSLPSASSLCGACFEVCPVRIDIPRVLTHLRAQAVDYERSHSRNLVERTGFRAATAGLASPRLYNAGLRLGLPVAHAVAGDDGFSTLPGPGAAWTRSRDLPAPPAQSFRSWWADQSAADAADRTEPNDPTDAAEPRP
jgi:L-lactate dehydrogenase complex protein LldF